MGTWYPNGAGLCGTCVDVVLTTVSALAGMADIASVAPTIAKQSGTKTATAILMRFLSANTFLIREFILLPSFAFHFTAPSRGIGHMRKTTFPMTCSPLTGPIRLSRLSIETGRLSPRTKKLPGGTW